MLVLVMTDADYLQKCAFCRAFFAVWFVIRVDHITLHKNQIYKYLQTKDLGIRLINILVQESVV